MAEPKGIITTSLVISFGDPDAGEEDLFLSAEIDDREEGFNKGETDFKIGDSPYYLVYKSAGLTYTTETTAGSAGAAGSALVKVVETVSFAKSNEGNLSKPPSGSVTWLHVGGSGPTPTVVAGTTKLTMPTKVLSVWQATYFASADVWRLSGVGGIPGVAEVQVIVFLTGKKA